MARALLCPIPTLSLNHKVFKYAYWWDVGQTVELLTKESFQTNATGISTIDITLQLASAATKSKQLFSISPLLFRPH